MLLNWVAVVLIDHGNVLFNHLLQEVGLVILFWSQLLRLFLGDRLLVLVLTQKQVSLLSYDSFMLMSFCVLCFISPSTILKYDVWWDEKRRSGKAECWLHLLTLKPSKTARERCFIAQGERERRSYDIMGLLPHKLVLHFL